MPLTLMVFGVAAFDWLEWCDGVLDLGGVALPETLLLVRRGD